MRHDLKTSVKPFKSTFRDYVVVDGTSGHRKNVHELGGATTYYKDSIRLYRRGREIAFLYY